MSNCINYHGKSIYAVKIVDVINCKKLLSCLSIYHIIYYTGYLHALALPGMIHNVLSWIHYIPHINGVIFKIMEPDISHVYIT